MHTANRPPTTRHPSALRIRPAQLTPRCARRLAGTRVDGFFARCVPCRSSSRPPCLGGAEAARGGAAGSSWVRVRHVAHPRIAPYCRLPSWPLGADCRRGCGAADAPAVRRARGGQGALWWSLKLRFGCASGMWPRAKCARFPRVRMAMWPSEVARGRRGALDSLKLTLN